MTFITSHPTQHTARVRVWSKYRSYRFEAPIRRIAGVTTRTVHIDVLRNNAGIVRASWDASYSFGSITVAIIRK